MVTTRVRTDGGNVIVETDNGTDEEIRAIIKEVWEAVDPRTQSCDEMHPTLDVWHQEGHPAQFRYSLEIV